MTGAPRRTNPGGRPENCSSCALEGTEIHPSDAAAVLLRTAAAEEPPEIVENFNVTFFFLTTGGLAVFHVFEVPRSSCLNTSIKELTENTEFDTLRMSPVFSKLAGLKLTNGTLPKS